MSSKSSIFAKILEIMERQDLYTQKDLDRIFPIDGILDYDVAIHNDSISLAGITRVKGSLSFYDSRNLYLPKTLQYSIEKSRLHVGGDVRFYTLNLPKDNDILTYVDVEIPYIDKDPFYYQKLTSEQRDFLLFLYENYEKGIIIDVKGQTNYIIYLLDYIAEKYIETRPDLSTWLNKLKKLRKGYPNLVWFTIYEKFKYSGMYEEAWQLYLMGDYINVYDIGFYEEKLHRRLFDANMLILLEVKSVLSDFGKQHIQELMPLIDKQIASFETKWRQSFLQVFVNQKNYQKEQYDFYRQFYISQDFFDEINSTEYDKHLTSTYDDTGFPHVVHNAIKEQCRKFLIEAEDQYRESIGMPKVGEFWISETRLYYSIKAKFSHLEIKQHASPKWLGRQHLDVYIPQYNIALEYQGAQHYRPVDYFGGKEGFEKTKERDKIKKEKCEANNCRLIYVDEGYDFNELVASINNLIKEIESPTSHRFPPPSCSSPHILRE